jgi:hypothetical protein
MGSATSSAVGVKAGMRGAVVTAAVAAGAGGISSWRGSDVAAVGLSFISFDPASSALLPLAEKRWIAKAATATREPMSRTTASRPFVDTAMRCRVATLGMPGSPGSGEIVLPSASGSGPTFGPRSRGSLRSCVMVCLPCAPRWMNCRP